MWMKCSKILCSFLSEMLDFVRSLISMFLAKEIISHSRCREILVQNLPVVGYDCKQYGLNSCRSSGASSAAYEGVPGTSFKNTEDGRQVVRTIMHDYLKR